MWGTEYPAADRNGPLRPAARPALVPAVLVARVEEQLQAQADAQKRLAGVDGRQHRLDQAAAAQFGHGVLKRPDAGQHDLRGRGHHGRVAGDDGLVADLLEALLHAAKVAHPVVDDGDHGEEGGELRIWGFADWGIGETLDAACGFAIPIPYTSPSHTEEGAMVEDPRPKPETRPIPPLLGIDDQLDAAVALLALGSGVGDDRVVPPWPTTKTWSGR